ncbi:MAG TPA: AAA family ATPase [Pirellulales bacterium]|jgi:general secretion pathway protein A|nr:AAA family ATPase [Pirellulales bacterium]
MYEAYWQLDRRPFENTSDARFYYPGESHQGAMLKLRYAVENRRAAALLCGASGSGKTLLVRQLRRHLSKQYRPFVHLVFPQMPTEMLLAYVADELGAPGESILNNVEQTVRRIQEFLIQNAAQDQHAIVAIDEAHLLDDSRTWEALRLLLNFEADSQPLLTLLLAGQPGLLPQMERMPALEERLGVKCLLRPFTIDETAAYVNFRLQAAGAKRPIFEAAAMETLQELTHGLARKINRLCDLAMLVGFAEEHSSISAEQLEAVADELVTVAPE